MRLDYSNLVSSFDGKTIKLPVTITPANKAIRPAQSFPQLILDTGADTTALTREFLKKSGYGKYSKSAIKKRTAAGEVELFTCDIGGLTIANQFKFGQMKVDVLENWAAHTVVGVIGMDILSQMTFILSHEHGKFMLTNRDVLDLAKLFGNLSH